MKHEPSWARRSSMVSTASELTSRAAAAVMAELASDGLPTRSDRDDDRLRLVRLSELHSSARWGACTLATDIVDGTVMGKRETRDSISGYIPWKLQDIDS